MEEISEFYELMQERHGEIPGEIHEYIENLLIKEVRNKFMGASELVDMVNKLLLKGHVRDEKELIGAANEYLESNYKYLYA